MKKEKLNTVMKNQFETSHSFHLFINFLTLLIFLKRSKDFDAGKIFSCYEIFLQY